MNYLYRSLVGAGSRAGAEASAKKINPIVGGPIASKAKVALELATGKARIPKTILGELKLLEWVDLLKSFLARFWATFWVVSPCKGF